MASTTKIFRNDAALPENRLFDTDSNGIKNENNNLIGMAEMILDDTNHTQTSRAVSYMALRSNAFQSILNVNVIELFPYVSAAGGLLAPTLYLDGASIRFLSPVTNDGVTSYQIDLAGLGPKDIILTGNSILPTNALKLGEWAEVYFDAVLDKFILITPFVLSIGSFFMANDLTITNNSLFNIPFDSTNVITGTAFNLIAGNIVFSQTGIYRINFDFASNGLEYLNLDSFNRRIKLELIIYKNGNPIPPTNIVYNQLFQIEDLNAISALPGTITLDPIMSIFINIQISAGDSLTFAFRDKESNNDLIIAGGNINNQLNVELITVL